ncbi:MAG: DUF4127 family protein [Armatimonadetes bacterium]|nr:DUF4127 family protein [Armatimonadota bacterium]
MKNRPGGQSAHFRRGRLRYIVVAMLRACAAFVLAVAFLGASAERILVVPLDSRPSSTDFPRMLARIAAVEVQIPSTDLLGRFTEQGQATEIASWLESRDYEGVAAVVVSADMLAYGGLIASRVAAVSETTAIKRLDTLRELRAKHPDMPIYVFSALMRTAPTATARTRSWRLNLARYVELQEKYDRTGERRLLGEVRRLKGRVPSKELSRYRLARKRNMAVHKALIRLVDERVITYLIIGADDAQKYGPHYPETQELRGYVRDRGIAGLVYICGGVDQCANMLVSRALLRSRDWTPHVFVHLSDEKSASRRANFESQPLSISIRDQIIASGARPTSNRQQADYVLYVNAPQTDGPAFEKFTETLLSALQDGGRVAVADINIKSGAGDARLIEALWKPDRAPRLLAYAGWNTAANTLGTTIPQANLYLLATRAKGDAVARETAQRQFLLHRFVNDYGYHRFVRPEAYRLVDSDPHASREEAHGAALGRLEDWVSRNTISLLEKYFDEVFMNSTFVAGEEQYWIYGLNEIRVTLPWPRAFEARIEFEFLTQPVERGS